jgi:hypothetical protein
LVEKVEGKTVCNIVKVWDLIMGIRQEELVKTWYKWQVAFWKRRRNVDRRSVYVVMWMAGTV